MPFDATSFIMGQRSVDPNAEYYTKAQMDVLLAQKQNVLTFDSIPTENSSNPVTSDGIYDVLGSIVKFANNNISAGNLTCTISFTGTLVYAFAISGGKEIVVDKTINSNSVVFSLNEILTNAVNCFVIYV